MILTQKDVWSTICEIKTTLNKIPDISTLMSKVTSKFNISESDKLKKALTHQLNLYRKRDRHCELSTTTVFSCDDEEAPPPAKIPNLSVPASRKCFLDLKLQTQHKRSDDLLKTTKDFLTKENEGYENPMSITQLLGYLIHRLNYSKDKKTAAIGMIYTNRNT